MRPQLSSLPSREMLTSSNEGDLSEVRPRGPFTGSHMLNVKNARLRSEHDVNLLRNRLERLRQVRRGRG